ncbi:CRISPR-associated RAMP protein Csx10 [Calothrix sp. FACHB-1219]|uniref:type III-D CRISPR-associated RAMP protein Csx10 n=1 Tax=unclassified Calothrix TaxID=2619626 RepID=UPI00168A1E24|nr:MULTISPECIES: CRISPR-associated RAMP protein Csx10 [unclassified Calothrix]MBD2203834.1 CRISPR-associated RAMP protein Csx10 [Calothrix sp. FACHB-168]MBD2219653.1 CRISPR-associated RAMP protein Csx10 [Calothrix sp. FACHB-1219]
MKKINLEIKALSPLAIGRQKPGGNVSEVEKYIPGSVIRGAIASQILKQANSSTISENDDFYKLFLSENPAIFQNAYPGIITIDTDCVLKDDVKVLPATVLSSKNKSGFTTDEQNKNGAFDSLIDRLCAEKYGQIYDPNCPTEKSTYGERVDNYSSFYSEHNDDYYSPSANTRLLTRVGINRRRATSEERVLYSIAVLNESQENKKRPVTYIGAVFVKDDLAVALQQFIQNHQHDLRLGGAGSRGLGKVKITAKAPSNIKSKVIKRIDDFNQKLRHRWSKWGDIFGNPLEELPENRIYFTLDLQADAILTENWQRTTVISPKMLQQYTGVNDSSLDIHAAYSSYDYRSGWNSAWGLMKDVELVTNKGSVYLFSTENKNLWLQAWEDLEVYGVGDRTCEGFGQVQICNEFHFILREEAV